MLLLLDFVQTGLLLPIRSFSCLGNDLSIIVITARKDSRIVKVSQVATSDLQIFVLVVAPYCAMLRHGVPMQRSQVFFYLLFQLPTLNFQFFSEGPTEEKQDVKQQEGGYDNLVCAD